MRNVKKRIDAHQCHHHHHSNNHKLLLADVRETSGYHCSTKRREDEKDKTNV
jgi:hypothetical protein